jgi:hypothetical protein
MKQLSSCIRKGLALSLLISLQASAQVNVLTYHNDNSRLGANLSETTLTPANVNANSFGKLFSYDVDGYVYAQPLYVSGLGITGLGTHNVVIVATEHNSVYAFDADSNTGANGGLLWHVNLGTAVPTPNPSLNFNAIKPEVGITGTPVIDLGSQTLYVDAFTWDGTSFFHNIHALNLADGSEKPFSPVLVAASVPGNGAGSSNHVVSFQARQQLQRSALTLAGGVLYVCFAGFTDTPTTDPYHGWVLGYNPGTLQLLPGSVSCTTPNGTAAQFGSIAGRGAIWMGGGGPAVDGGNNLYFATGDGNFTAYPNSHGNDYGDTYLKLSTGGGLSVADYFTPNNPDYLQAHDQDAGSGGVIILPDQPGPFPHLLIGAGKPSSAFVINRDQMTSDNRHINTNGNNQIVQEMPLGGGAFDTPAYFNERIYYGAKQDVLRAYSLSNGTLIPDLPNSFGTRKFPFPGATPSISANGDQDGVLWAIQNAQPAVLVAYNATNLSSELYSSSQAPGQRDQLTGGVKFAVPTIANGKVFVGSQMSVSVFGLLSGGSGGGGWTPIAANYSGLFSEGSGAEFGRSGFVSIKTTKKGSYSGRASLGGRSYPFRGTFDATGASTTSTSTKSIGTLTFTLQVNTDDNSAITGLIGGDGWAANLTANQELFNKRSNPAPFAGKYNLVLPGPGDGDPTHPQDDGTGTLTVTADGRVKFKGVLGDGTRVSESATVSQSGDWPFYIPLYKQGGQIMGWLNFDGAGNVGGPTSWIKLQNDHSKTFPDGFELNPTATGSAQ